MIIQIILLGLIGIGVALLLTQSLWVPRVVDFLLAKENSRLIPANDFIVVLDSSSTATTIEQATSTPVPVPAPVKITSGVKGTVAIGPICPIVQYPDDGSCADKPYQTSLLVTTENNPSGIKQLITTDAEGHFSSTLLPGTYMIQASDQVTMPRLNPQTFVITENNWTFLDLAFDSGIR